MTDISDRVRILGTEILSDNHYVLRKVTFAWRRGDGVWQESAREAYDRGNGCAILLFDRARRRVVLTKQFRMPAFLNGYRDMLIEAAAGLLDEADPEARIRAEAREETGYAPRNVTKVFETFMSPGSVTEKLYLFTGEYDTRDGAGGGLAEEGEDIEVLELAFDDAVAMMQDGRICDAKTIMLLQYAQINIFKS
jgi:nudix-type nucleoside diphosphatase (YffH/AdpP family)